MADGDGEAGRWGDWLAGAGYEGAAAWDEAEDEEVQVQGPRGEKVYADVFFLTVGAGRV